MTLMIIRILNKAKVSYLQQNVQRAENTDIHISSKT